MHITSKTYVLAILLSISVCSNAQKNIVISDSLFANAEEMSVKQGASFGKVKIHFGDYNIVSSKAGGTTTTTKGNIWGTKSESNSKAKFSFTMTSAANDTAIVNATNYTASKSTQAIRISPHFYLGADELQQWTQNFTALITVNGDTSNTWALLMNGSVKIDTAPRSDAYLINGDRKIFLNPVTSNSKGEDNRLIPALGYQFVESGQALCALQYYGGGLLGRNKVFVWIDKRLDAKTKLLMASAMTAVLQQIESDL